MPATASTSTRDFQSYLDEYFLQTTEVEINAFWQRMDKIIADMPAAEKKKFFEQLLASIEKGTKEIRDLKAKLFA